MFMVNKTQRSSIKTGIKKTLRGTLICISILSFLPPNVFAVYGGASNPFPIRNMVDLYRVVECIRVNKNWSNGKHFSLQTSLELKKSVSLTNSSEEHQFNGIFHGNGHTITLTSGDSFFGYIGKSGIVENLTIAGKGDFASQNCGMIKGCHSSAEASYGIVSTNKGSIQDCTVQGKISSAGISSVNSGVISGCTVSGRSKDTVV
jgi:hypothetical protein